ncbi:MAG TPA: hypothetical protein VGQ83_15000 [Polyangia bacterium]|jgi:hypothetical protein
MAMRAAWAAVIGVALAFGWGCGGEDPGGLEGDPAPPGTIQPVTPPPPGPDQRPAQELRPPVGTCVHGVYWLTEYCWITTCTGEACDLVRDHCNQPNCNIPNESWYDPGYPEPLDPGHGH